MKRWLSGSRKTNRYIDSIYAESDISQRYSCIARPDEFFKADNGRTSAPGTRARNDLFTAAARELFVGAAGDAVRNCPNASFDDVTHLITVSCTGFYNPGPDCDIIEALNLGRDIQRYNIGFMGCCAAFPALRLARTICMAEPHAVVLVAAVELCSLHIQLKEDLDSILGAALFADGGAAAVVSTRKPLPGQTALELNHFESTLIPNSRDKMAWTIGDSGFEMVLSSYIPKVLEANIAAVVSPLLDSRNLTVSDIDHWAIHPGGKAILDRIEAALGLKQGCRASRDVLKNFGNMSSATILFVLQHIMRQPARNREETVFAMAFGPGLTVESALMEKITSTAAQRPFECIAARSVHD